MARTPRSTPVRGTIIAILFAIAFAAGALVTPGPASAHRPHANHGARDRDHAGRVSRDFFGMLADEIFWTPNGERDTELSRVAATGVGLLRQPFHWQHFEPSPGRYDFSRADGFVGAAALRGMRVLPVLFDPPSFYSTAPPGAPRQWTYPPTDVNAYARWAAATAGRYGEGGAFWQEHPEIPYLPIEAWQIWNEPNLRQYWPSGPDPAGYARLLEAAANAIRSVNPHAEIVSAGLSFSPRALPIERFLRGMYRAGARHTFDTLAVHAYATSPHLVTDLLVRARRALRHNGDARKPIRVTETGWGTGGPRGQALNVGRKAQRLLVHDTFLRLARLRHRLRIRGVILFSWRNQGAYTVTSQHDFWGLHAGLLDNAGRPKPALAAFSRLVHRLTARPGLSNVVRNYN